MQEIVAQMLNYFWDEFIIIMIWHCGRGELSTNLYFIYPRIYSNYWSAWRQTGLLSANCFFLSTNLRESGEFTLIIVVGLGRNLIEFWVCLAADGFVICELFFLSTNLRESGEFARMGLYS